jgi:DNA-binding transcriptional LysR family regulator
VPRYRVMEELLAGKLKVVLEGCPPPDMPVSVLYPQSRQLSSRVRVFVEWLRGVFEGP